MSNVSLKPSIFLNILPTITMKAPIVVIAIIKEATPANA